MHYYNFNIADYRKDTGHLTHLEHGIYRQILDTYYLDEKPIKTQSVIRRLRIVTEDEKLAFKNILDDFFEESECGDFYYHRRANEEISAYQAKAETARANGSKGGRPKKPIKTQPVNLANPEETQPKANQEPITNNHKPITKNTSSAEPNNIDHRHAELFERFWSAGMRKVSKKKCEPIFKKIISKKTDPEDFAEFLVADIQLRIKSQQQGFSEMHPTTYLNGERWNDEIPSSQSQTLDTGDPEFQMSLGWMPSSDFSDLCEQGEVSLDYFGEVRIYQIIGEFRSFYFARGDTKTQRLWEHTLFQRFQKLYLGGGS